MPQVLSQVLYLPTSSAIWSYLEKRFNSLSRPHVQQLKMRLHILHKGAQSIQSYLDEVKHIVDSLASVSETVSDDDLVLYILKGLPAEYDTIKALIRVSKEPLSVVELSSLLLNKELHLKLVHNLSVSDGTPSDVHTALNTQRNYANNGNNRGRGRNYNNRGRGNRGGFGNNNNLTYNSQTSTKSTNLDTNIYCQISGKPNHQALDCWHRFDGVSYVSPKANKQALTAQTGSSSSGQTDHAPWYLDSGANSHVTRDLAFLSSYYPYEGGDSVSVGNGINLPIAHTGHGGYHCGQPQSSNQVQGPL